MDDIDRAQDRAIEDTERAIAASRQQAARIRPAIGICYNCEASVAPGHHFCDADCRDDYEYRQKREGK